MSNRRYQPGLTVASVFAMIFALFAVAILLQWDDVIISSRAGSSEHMIPIPAMVVLLLLVAVGALVWKVLKVRILSKPEMLCVLFATLIAIPLMTQGFWQRFVSVTATIPQDPDMFKYLDVYPEKLWPHGENIVDGAFKKDARDGRETTGSVTWEEVEIQPGKKIIAPILKNANSHDKSSIRIRVPIERGGKKLFSRREPFLISILARPGTPSNKHKLDAGSRYYCRIYPDESDTFLEAFSSNKSGEITYMQKSGFMRIGDNAFEIPREIDKFLILEFGLKGVGQVALTDPKMFSVDALESAMTGKQWVSQSEYDKLPPSERGSLLIKPDNMWSIAGLKYFFSAYIPVSQWVHPVLVWTTLIILLMLAAMAMNVILRKQWMENERYLMPMVRIPMAFIGDPPADDASSAGQKPESPLTKIWVNRAMWLGLAIGLAWILFRGWSFFNPKIPDLSVRINLQQHFKGDAYGNMFNGVFFTVSAIFLSLAIFVEMNMLLSISFFYLVWRASYWFGEISGWGENSGYPYQNEQQTGGYLIYALLIIVLTRKYLWGTIKAAIKGDKEASKGEMFSYRFAFLLLIACFVLSQVFAWYVGMSFLGMLTLFGFMVIIALITAKIRTECGAPYSYIGPAKITLVLVLLGGISTFGAEAVLFGVVIGFMFGGTPFFLIPGAQMELAELGRRFRVKPRHLTGTILIGLTGGMVIGGWVFLSNSYGIGGWQVRNSWAYNSKAMFIRKFSTEMKGMTTEYKAELSAQDTSTASAGKSKNASVEKDAPIMAPEKWGYVVGALVTVILAVLRQIWAIFPLHPAGYLIASTSLGSLVWGSCLVAWIIRIVVLRIGGAETVRKKLQPFFIGVFVGAIVGHMILLAYSGYLMSEGVDMIHQWKAMP